MVVILLPSTAATGITQERVATPSMCTVQAPHWAMPQPYLVPVRPTCSRITHSSGVLGSTSTLVDLPLRVKRAIACLLFYWVRMAAGILVPHLPRRATKFIFAAAHPLGIFPTDQSAFTPAVLITRSQRSASFFSQALNSAGELLWVMAPRPFSRSLVCALSSEARTAAFR